MFMMFMKRVTLALLLVLTVNCAYAQRVVLGGNPQGSQLYPMSQAISTVLNEHSSLRVDVLPQGGSVLYPMMLTDEVDFAMVNPMDALSAVRGEPPYDLASAGRGFPMQTLMLGSPIPLSIIAAKDAGINSVEDLRGRRVVANYGAFASAGHTAEAILASAGMSLDDVEVVTVSSYTEGVRAVMEGRAVASTGSVGSGIIRELDASRGAKFLPVNVDDAGMQAIRELGPALFPFQLEPGQPGVEEPTWVIAYEIPIVARTSLSDDIAYAVVKTIWENYAQLAQLYAPLATWTPDRFASTQALLPYHPGAIRFYREVGVWTQEMEDHQAELAAGLR